MAIINKSTINKYYSWRRCEEKGTLVHCWWECNLVQPLWKTVWNFIKKLKMNLPFDLAIPLLRLYPETAIQKNLCTPTFRAAQFTIAKCWKQQPKCPWVNERTKKKKWYIYTISTTQQKERSPTLCDLMDGTGEHYAKWNKPGSKRQIPYDLTYKWNLINKKNKEVKHNQRHWSWEWAHSD